MKQGLYKFIYHRLLGWKTQWEVPEYDKCVIVGAPHTSNWDLLFGKLFYGTLNRKVNFLMKKEWFFFPLGPLFKLMGGIPVDRSRKTSLTDQLATRFSRSHTLHLAITPEATRRPNPDWKKGFYYIAQGAGVPIVLAYIDYKEKRVGIERTFTPTGDVEADMRAIKSYYQAFHARKPENFITGL